MASKYTYHTLITMGPSHLETNKSPLSFIGKANVSPVPPFLGRDLFALESVLGVENGSWYL